jgi:hypothetical protein
LVPAIALSATAGIRSPTDAANQGGQFGINTDWPTRSSI